MASRPWNAYFSIVSVVLLVLSVAAFSDNLFTDIGQPSNRDPKFIAHGAFGLAWYALLVVQANLIRTRNITLHKRIGIAALVVAAGVVVSTLYIFIVTWKGWSNMGPEVRANRLFLPGYALCVSLAWFRRGNPTGTSGSSSPEHSSCSHRSCRVRSILSSHHGWIFCSRPSLTALGILDSSSIISASGLLYSFLWRSTIERSCTECTELRRQDSRGLCSCG